MAKRYGMNTPDVLRRRQNIADQQAAAYQARLMPNPGTPEWEMGLETSTPFFDIATVGMGGGMNLLRKGNAQKLAEARLRRQPAYTSPSTAMQDQRFFTGLKDDRLQRGAWNREFALDKWRKQADAPEKQIRKIRAKIEMERRGAANRRRRMQGSMADDL